MRLIITPSGILYQPKEPELKNHLLRKYIGI
jgi:hypothetical protein